MSDSPMFGIAIACALLVGLLVLSLALSRPSWPYHANGAKGFITDMLVYTFLPVAPVLLCVGGFSIFTALNPQYENMTARYVVIAVAVVGLLAMRRLPYVVQAQGRVRAARNARYEAMKP